MTAADGTFAFPDLRPGPYLLGVAARAYTVHWQEVVLTNGGETTIEVRLLPLPASISGKVTSSDSGAPVAGASISIGTWSAVTDDAGLYDLEGIAPGPYTLLVTAADHESFDMTVNIGPGAHETVDVPLTPVRASLRVRVVDASTGRPIEEAMLTLDANEGLPGADYKLLVPLKRSRPYGLIRRRVADLRPVDAWRQDDLHLFAFTLRPLNGDALAEPPLAVFAMHPDLDAPVSAIVVTSHGDDTEADVADLLGPDTASGEGTADRSTRHPCGAGSDAG